MNKCLTASLVLLLSNICFAETIPPPLQRSFDIIYNSPTSNKATSVHINGNPIGSDQLLKDTISHIDQLSPIFEFNVLTGLDIAFIQWISKDIVQEKWTVNKQKDLWITFNSRPPAGFPSKTQIIISEDDKIPNQKTLTTYTPPPSGTQDLMSIHLNVKEDADFEDGLKLFDENKFTEAIGSFDKAIKSNAENSRAYFYRANSYYNLGSFEQAVADYFELIKLEPENSDAYSNRGDAFRKLNKLEEAIADFDKAIQLNPENLLAYGNRGNAHSSLGNYQKALEDYSKEIDTHPETARTYGNRAITYFYLKDYAKSWQDVEKAQSIGLFIDPILINELKKRLE